jgi:symplekin
MLRIWDTSRDFVPASSSSEIASGSLQETRSQDLWMLLLVRLLTRSRPDTQEEEKDEEEAEGGMEVDQISKHDRVRELLFDYVLNNFPAK